MYCVRYYEENLIEDPWFLSEYILGGPNFLEFYVPLPTPFYSSLLTNFRKSSKFGVLCSAIFRKISQNFPKISWNFLNFFKIEKTRYFYTQNSP